MSSGSKLFREESDERLREKYRTESWLELCIYHERICSPDENMWFTPLKIVTPVPGLINLLLVLGSLTKAVALMIGAEDIRLSLSGFDESESWPIRRLIRALGVFIPVSQTVLFTLLYHIQASYNYQTFVEKPPICSAHQAKVPSFKRP